MNGLRNLLTVIFAAGGVGLHGLFPNIPLAASVSVGLLIRAAMDEFWPATGLTKNWKTSFRNYLTVVLCAGEGLSVYFPVIPSGVSSTIALVVRASLDQLWPAPPATPAPAPSK